MPNPSAKFSFKKPYGLCPLWTRHIFHLLRDTLKYWVTGWKASAVSRQSVGILSHVSLVVGARSGLNSKQEATQLDGYLPSQRWPQFSLIRAGCCLFQENPRRAATVIGFPTDHQFCHTGALSRFFNMEVTCLTEYWFKEKSKNCYFADSVTRMYCCNPQHLRPLGNRAMVVADVQWTTQSCSPGGCYTSRSAVFLLSWGLSSSASRI